MKTAVHISALAVLLAAPGPCFALWGLSPVTKENAKKLGVEIRTTLSGPDHVIVELEFKTDGRFKGFSRVNLRVGEGDNPAVTAALKEDKSKPGIVVVSFTAEREQADKTSLWLMVPGSLGGTAYTIAVKDFVERRKDR